MKKLLNNRALCVLIISFILIVFGAFLASATQTIGFSYKVYSKTIKCDATTSAGLALEEEAGVQETSVADIYKPKSANSDNTVPLIIVVPGIQRTKETQASFCIELARRGYGVICIDPFNQGDSSSTYEKQSATNEGYGLFNWVDYIFDCKEKYENGEIETNEFAWVDYDNIGACGHSAGGNACQKLAEREGKIAAQNHTTSRVKSIYITGYIREWTWANTQCNIGISYSKNDEGAFQNKTGKLKTSLQEKKDNGETLSEEEEWWLTVGNADNRYTEETVTLVNYQLNRYDGSSVEKLAPYEGANFTVDTVEIGKQYGNPYTNTYCIINNESCLHAFQPYDSATLSHLVEFFDYTFDHEEASKISSSKVSYWWGKEIGSGIALVFAFVFICALAVVLLQTPAFASLKHEIPARTGNQKVKGRIIFWISFAVSAFFGCILYMIAVKLSTSLMSDAYQGIQTWKFPQRFTNAVMLWAVFSGLIGIAIFAITWGLEWLIDLLITKNKYQGEDQIAAIKEVNATYISKLEPLKISSPLNALKGLGFCAIIIGSFFALDYLTYLIFHVDFRFMFVSARVTFNPNIILATVMYLPFFFIFYFSNSLRVNCSMRPENWKEWLSQIIAVLGNTLGLVAIVLIEYVPMIKSGTIGYTSTLGPQWLFVNLLFSIIPMMALLPILNRFFFNKTGRAWIGPIVTVVIFIAMTSAATTIYYALG